MQPILLDVVPDRNGLFCGVVALHLNLSELRGKTSNLLLAMSVNEIDAGLRELLHVDANDKCTIFVYTHLIPNGPASIKVELLSDSKSVVAVGVRDALVGNFGSIARKVERSLIEGGAPVFTQKPCDSSAFNYEDSSLIPWFDKEDAHDTVETWCSSGTIDSFVAQKLREFIADGFIVLENVLPDSLIDQCNREIDDAVSIGFKGYVYGSSQRIEHMHEKYPGFREIWRNAEIHKWLSLIFQEDSLPCQSLTYVFGSQQEAHQDTVHLTPFPAGYMCGVWIALQDIVPNSGELIVYRGSHRLPRVYMSDVGCDKVGSDWDAFGKTVVSKWRQYVQEGKFEKITYRPKKGAVLIWHENLMHGGSVRLDQSLSRRSVVTHNFARGAIVYYDSTGMAGHVAADAVS